MGERLRSWREGKMRGFFPVRYAQGQNDSSWVGWSEDK